MRLLQRILGALTVTAAGALLSPAAPAVAEEWGINGTFRAQSNGQWAQTNDRYQDEPSAVATWSVETTCTTRFDCVGEVHSDQGWSGALYTRSGTFYVRHLVPGWQQCPGGAAGDGMQVFRFYPARPDGRGDMLSTTLFVGEDTTTGISGTCGVSKPRVVRLPFKLTQVT